MPAPVEQDVPAHLRGERADKIVAELAGVSREQARRLFKHGVTVDGTAVGERAVAGGSIDFPQTPEEIGTVAEEVDFESGFRGASRFSSSTSPRGVTGPIPGLAGEPGPWLPGFFTATPISKAWLRKEDGGLFTASTRALRACCSSPGPPSPYEFLTAQLAARKPHRSAWPWCTVLPAMPTGTIDAPIGRDPSLQAQEGRARRPSRRAPITGCENIGDNYVAGSRFRVSAAAHQSESISIPSATRGLGFGPTRTDPHSFASHLIAHGPPGFHPPRDWSRHRCRVGSYELATTLEILRRRLHNRYGGPVTTSPENQELPPRRRKSVIDTVTGPRCWRARSAESPSAGSARYRAPWVNSVPSAPGKEASKRSSEFEDPQARWRGRRPPPSCSCALPSASTC